MEIWSTWRISLIDNSGFKYTISSRGLKVVKIQSRQWFYVHNMFIYIKKKIFLIVI